MLARISVWGWVLPPGAQPAFQGRSTAEEGAATGGFGGPDPLRDVLPIPLGEGFDAAVLGAGFALLSKHERLQAQRRAPYLPHLWAGVRALNALAGGEAPAGDRPLSRAQTLAVLHLAALYRDVGKPPDGMDPQQAWQSLRLARSGYADDVTLAAHAGRRSWSLAA